MTENKKKSKIFGQLFAILIVGIVAVWFTIFLRKWEVANEEKARLEQENLQESLLEKNETSYQPADLKEVITNPQQAELPVNYKGMNISFNSDKHIPNWVAWELTAEKTYGTTPRYNKFLQDASVDGCPYPWDYSNSGYTRGHMAPAGDMKWDETAMKETFFMTNICPQANSLNAGSWLRLEEKCRQWAEADGRIIIICGPVLTDSIREYIGETGVAVPQRFFKVILSPDATPMRGIAFIMNNGEVEGGMQKAATSIREVERITGHDFFAALPDSIEETVENQTDFPFWSTIR